MPNPAAYALFDETRPQAQDSMDSEDPRSAFKGYRKSDLRTGGGMLEASMLGSAKNQEFQKRAFEANKKLGSKIGEWGKGLIGGKKQDVKLVPGVKRRTENPTDPDMTYVILRSILEQMGVGI